MYTGVLLWLRISSVYSPYMIKLDSSIGQKRVAIKPIEGYEEGERETERERGGGGKREEEREVEKGRVIVLARDRDGEGKRQRATERLR